MFQESLAKVALKKICVRNLMNSAVLYSKWHLSVKNVVLLHSNGIMSVKQQCNIIYYCMQSIIIMQCNIVILCMSVNKFMISN